MPDVGGGDVDCFRTANGPVYTDERNFRVVGADVYGLDADDDLVACEDDGSDLAAATGGGTGGGGQITTAGQGRKAGLARTGQTSGRPLMLASGLAVFGLALLIAPGALVIRKRWPA